MTAINLFLRLLFTHVVMDFTLQPKCLVCKKTKGNKGEIVLYNLLHSILHALAAYLVIGEWKSWQVPLTLFISHFLIDFGYKKEKEDVKTFVIDQILHLAVIIGIVCMFIFKDNPSINDLPLVLQNNTLWKILIAYLLVTRPSSILIQKFIERWNPERLVNDCIVQENTPAKDKGLEKAGEWIGYLERILIVTFIFINQWSAIGFLLAAKSIFRYGNLKENKEIRMTEYVLIGTLFSFTLAIAIGLLFSI